MWCLKNRRTTKYHAFYDGWFFDERLSDAYNRKNGSHNGVSMADTMRDYSEKRDFHRMQVDSGINVTDPSGNTFQGHCRDLSGTGMQILLDQPMEEGTQLHTILPSSSDQFPSFETVVTVIRCVPEGEGYLLGTAIAEVKR